MNTGELLAREQIRDLVARYNSLGDRGLSVEVAELFDEDGVLEVADAGGTRTASGKPSIRDLLEEIKSSWRDESGEDRPLYVRHVVGTHVIDLLAADSARGVAYVLVLRAEGLVAGGRYFDDYRQIAGRWVFASRRAVADTRSAASAVLDSSGSRGMQKNQ
ncbi:nuclear transport factor 2 family protein [Nocardia neocaledoniensis]|uniref:nuclear transport factor 2 family protein n=1 Tax=Nocardia neocaledoniensis TaxID=236511 RepID=UPI002457CD6E|nr:nuclear transport factor 2 family protein [Nocardia neocaledoniensis]